MIDVTLSLIAAQLNQHLRQAGKASEDKVLLCDLQEAAGPGAINKVALVLAGVERDDKVHRGPEPVATGGLSRLQGMAPLHLNLLLLCAARFGPGHYLEALAALSAVVAFFQGKSTLDHQNTPDMDFRLERVTLAIENLNALELNGLWGNHGGRYLPSVLYRVRIISLAPQQISHREQLIKRTVTSVLPVRE